MGRDRVTVVAVIFYSNNQINISMHRVIKEALHYLQAEDSQRDKRNRKKNS